MLLSPLFLSIILFVKQNNHTLYTSKIFKATVLLFFLLSLAYSSISILAHYKITERGATEFFLSNDDVKYWD